MPKNLTWTPSQAPYYKINVDGVVFAQLNVSGVGVVIRDSAGRVEAALSKNYSVPLGALETQALALAEGVRFAWEVGICDAVFESDSKIVSEAVLGNKTPQITIANGTSSICAVTRKHAHILAHNVKGIDNYIT